MLVLSTPFKDPDGNASKVRMSFFLGDAPQLEAAVQGKSASECHHLILGQRVGTALFLTLASFPHLSTPMSRQA
jgi:hypothetical protein